MEINRNYLNLKENYLFSDIASKVSSYLESNPSADIIRMGIGDVTLPLPPVVIKALNDAAAEMCNKETFKGYGPEQGYEFIRMQISEYYKNRNIDLSIDEIFISDGAKSDLGNILDILSKDNTVLIPDPVYPVYVDTNIMDGRQIQFINANMNNNFCPLPDSSVKADIIYLCSPNNPTGSVYNHSQLKAWVDYALINNALILFDAAYEAFVQDPTLPRSIYEISGAEQCCIEFCSLSKTAGFTGTRCGYTVIPEKVIFGGYKLNKLWFRRQSTKFNGVPYIVQRAASAVFTSCGQEQIKNNISYYMTNAQAICNTLKELEIWFTGGSNSPYIWMKCPASMSSWEFFDYLLSKANVVGTPGAGFGKNGEGFFRLTAFGDKGRTSEAMNRIKSLLK